MAEQLIQGETYPKASSNRHFVTRGLWTPYPELSTMFPNNVDISWSDQVGDCPAIHVVFSHGRFSKRLPFIGQAASVRIGKSLPANIFMVARVIHLVKLVTGTELASNRIPQQLH